VSDAPLRLLVVSGGHPYDERAFDALFEAADGIEATRVAGTEARRQLHHERSSRYDAVLFYDLSGIARDGTTHEPSAEHQRDIEALLARGTGLVLLNHGLLSWPAWPRWRALTRTSFLLREGELDGVRTPGSGFRGGASEPQRTVATRLRADAPGHPVLSGLEDGFEIEDELYLKTRRFERHVVALLRSDYAFVEENFSPPPLAPPEQRSRWTHPPGSNLVVWANAAQRSPVIACELGDGPSAYANPGFRRLVGNALRWVASEPARRWAAARSAA